MVGFAGLGPPTPEQREYQKKLAASGLTGSPFEAAPEACRNASMNVIEEMAQARERLVYGHDTPIPPDGDLVEVLGSALMDLARANPENCTARVTQALALFHVWEANRR